MSSVKDPMRLARQSHARNFRPEKYTPKIFGKAKYLVPEPEIQYAADPDNPVNFDRRDAEGGGLEFFHNGRWYPDNLSKPPPRPPTAPPPSPSEVSDVGFIGRMHPPPQAPPPRPPTAPIPQPVVGPGSKPHLPPFPQTAPPPEFLPGPPYDKPPAPIPQPVRSHPGGVVRESSHSSDPGFSNVPSGVDMDGLRQLRRQRVMRGGQAQPLRQGMGTRGRGG